MCKNIEYILKLIEEFNKYKNYRVLKDIVNFTFDQADEDDIEYIKTQKHFLLQLCSFYIKEYTIVGRYHLGSFFQKLLNSKLYERLDYERSIYNIPKQLLEKKDKVYCMMRIQCI